MINILTGFGSLMSTIFSMPVIIGCIVGTLGYSIFLMIRMSRRDYAASGGSHRGTKASAIVAAAQPTEPESPQVYSWADIVAQSDQDSGTEEDDGEAQRQALERTTGTGEHGAMATGRPADTPSTVGGSGAVRTDES